MSKRLLPIYEEDCELQAICVCVTQLNRLASTGQWRVLSYLVLRFLGTSWELPKPAKSP
jgi:hypothetical protein